MGSERNDAIRIFEFIGRVKFRFSTFAQHGTIKNVLEKLPAQKCSRYRIVVAISMRFFRPWLPHA